jgi:hypothetical protein
MCLIMRSPSQVKNYLSSTSTECSGCFHREDRDIRVCTTHTEVESYEWRVNAQGIVRGVLRAPVRSRQVGEKHIFLEALEQLLYFCISRVSCI